MKFTFSGDAGITGEPAASVSEITGAQAIDIEAPVAGSTPQATIAAGEGYTGTISWEPNHGTFAHATAYTANVVLTADATHKFATGATATVASAASVTGNTISADAAGNTLTFAAKFAATEAAAAGAPIITSQPTGDTITEGNSHTLTVDATSPDGGELSYQWFSRIGNTGDFTPVDNGATASITVTPTETTFYYCVVTNTKTGATATTNTETVAVTVNPAIKTIDSIALALTAPVATVTAEAATTTTTGVTVGTVEWNPTLTNNTFAYDQVYTAKIPVTAEEGYEFASGATVTGLTGAAYENGNVTVTFAKTGVDPSIAQDQTAVETAKTAIAEAFASATVAQAVVNDQTAAKNYVEGIITGLNLTGITTTVTDGEFTAAVEDTDGTSGSDGSYTFAVKADKNLATATTDTLTLTITKTPYVAPDATAVPVFAQQSYVLTSADETTATYTLTNANDYTGTLTWAVYDAADGGEASAVTAEYVDGTLTLNSVTGGSRYYVTVQEDAKAASSPRVALSVVAYVAPVLDGTATISGDAVVGSALTVVVAESSATTFTYQWKSDSNPVGTDSATYTTVDSDIGAAITCEVTAEGYTGVLTSNSITVTTAEEPPAEEVKPEFPNIPEAKPDEENKVYTSEIKSSETGTPVMGTITLRRADGEAFTLSGTVPADTVFTLIAEPKEGYKFSGWNKTTARMALLAEGGMDLSQPTVSGPYSELAQLSATFTLKDAPAVGNPTLRALQLSGMPQNRALIQADGAYTQGFSGSETGYELYFLPGETIGFTLAPVVSAAGNYTVAINGGTAETITASGVSGTVAGTPVAVTGTADTAVNVVITDTDTGKSTTYSITPRVNLPQAKFELSDQIGGTKVSELSMTLTDAYFDVAEFSIKLKDLTSYQGFATSAGVLLDKDTELKAVADAISSGLNNFEVDSLTVDGTTNTLTIRVTSKSGMPASGDNETLKLYLLQATEGYTSAVDGVKTLASDNTSKMDDVRYVAVINDGLNVSETSLVYLVAASADWELYAYANKEGNNAGVTRVTYVIMSVNGGVKTEIASGATGSLDAYGGLSALVNNGTYEITFKADGYKTTAKTVEIKDADKGIPAFMLLAGDVNGDGTINDVDRQALMTVYGEAAVNGVTTSGATKADFNDDGVVDIFDLGALLRNQSK